MVGPGMDLDEQNHRKTLQALNYTATKSDERSEESLLVSFKIAFSIEYYHPSSSSSSSSSLLPIAKTSILFCS